MPKRGENIYKRKDGRWEGRYIYSRKPDGKAVYHSIYGKSYADVRQKLQFHREETHRRQLRGCTMTVENLMEIWLTSMTRIKDSSRERYRLLIAKHILPELGGTQVCDVTAETLNTFVNNKLDHGRLDGNGGLSAKTVNDICIVIKSALKLAKRKYGYKSNEIDEVKAPAHKGKKIDVFGECETLAITTAILKQPNITNLSFLLCMETGLRLGEMCALKWSDFDFREGILHVRRTALRINYGGCTRLVIQTPKSDASERVIPLTAKMLSLLAQAKVGKAPEAYMLTGSAVKPMEPRTMQYRFHSFLRALQIPVRGIHMTRHSFATRCIELGMDAKSLSEVLGHSNVRTTLQMYTHPSMAVKRRFLEAASAIA